MFDDAQGLRTAPVVLVQFSYNAAMSHIMGIKREQQAGHLSVADSRLAAAQSIIQHLQRIGKPYKASLQHGQMLRRILAEFGVVKDAVTPVVQAPVSSRQGFIQYA